MRVRIQSDKGFTVTELVVVIGIMGILMGIVGTAMGHWLPKYHFNNYVLEIKGAIQNARLQAVRNRSNVIVGLDRTNGQCVVFSGVSTIGVFPAPDGVEFVELFGSTDNAQITFDSRGFSDKSGNICLKNDSETYKGVSLTLAGCTSIIRSSDGSTWN